MQDCKVNILGTEYDITINCDDEDRDGDTNFFSKVIRIRPFEKFLDKEATDTERKLEKGMLSDMSCSIAFCGKREKRNLLMMNTL